MRSLLAVLALAVPASAQVYNFYVPAQPYDAVWTINVPPPPPTALSARITITHRSMVSPFGYECFGPTMPSGWLTFGWSGAYILMSQGHLLAWGSDDYQVSHYFTSFDGTIDFDGPSGAWFQPGTVTSVSDVRVRARHFASGAPLELVQFASFYGPPGAFPWTYQPSSTFEADVRIEYLP